MITASSIRPYGIRALGPRLLNYGKRTFSENITETKRMLSTCAVDLMLSNR